MSKTYIKSLRFLPQSYNFSEFEFEGGKAFDLGDDGKSQESMESAVNADTLLVLLLSAFDDRKKVILLYQILREAGYNLNHADCAKTMAITREGYMALLKEIKQRAKKVLNMTFQ